MSQPLTILVGTMTGTAEMVAQDLQAAFAGRGIDAEILPMDNLDARVFERDGPFLVCTSTYGQGDVPDNARTFFEALEAARPDLSHVRYGLIALGDRTYNGTFCHGGIRFDTLLSELGAKRVGDMLLHDASSGSVPEEAAVEWCGPWADLCLTTVKQAA